MRGTVAKRLRRHAVSDTPDLTEWVGYTTVQQSSHSTNHTVMLSECRRQYYQLLKYLYKTEVKL